MQDLKTWVFGAVVAAGLGFSAVAEAKPVTYVLDSIDLNYNAYGSGLKIKTDTHSAPSPFTLDDGQSKTFKAFDIWTNESSLEWDDYCEQPISATFNFSSPLSSGTVTGETDGKSGYIFIFKYEKGVVQWDCPTVVDLGCVVYEIALSDAYFNKGFGNLNAGECYGATIFATVKQISSGDCSVVPTPTAAAAGLAMLGGMVFRRRRAA